MRTQYTNTQYSVGWRIRTGIDRDGALRTRSYCSIYLDLFANTVGRLIGLISFDILPQVTEHVWYSYENQFTIDGARHGVLDARHTLRPRNELGNTELVQVIPRTRCRYLLVLSFRPTFSFASLVPLDEE